MSITELIKEIQLFDKDKCLDIDLSKCDQVEKILLLIRLYEIENFKID
jgi:hypothetical protein